MKFSQRIGKRAVKTILQVESMDHDLKNRIWNVLIEDFFHKLEDGNYHPTSIRKEVWKIIWKEFFKNTIDTIPTYCDTSIVSPGSCTHFFKEWFFKDAEWFEIYDFIEFIAGLKIWNFQNSYLDLLNEALEKVVAGYRIVNRKVMQITSESEVHEIEEAIDNSGDLKSVNIHFLAALDFLADRKNPDFRNSIKESISAVEAFCIIITGDKDATLGEALVEIEKKHSLHKALKKAFSALYGFTSDAGGIRHALIDGDSEIEFVDAKFMLVSCSAFFNYLKTKLET
jgi:hypothetical protein